jgi:hypothetical protein
MPCLGFITAARHLDDPQEKAEAADCLDERLVLDGLRDVDVASELIAPLDLAGVVGRREDDGGDLISTVTGRCCTKGFSGIVDVGILKRSARPPSLP